MSSSYSPSAMAGVVELLSPLLLLLLLSSLLLSLLSEPPTTSSVTVSPPTSKLTVSAPSGGVRSKLTVSGRPVKSLNRIPASVSAPPSMLLTSPSIFAILIEAAPSVSIVTVDPSASTSSVDTVWAAAGPTKTAPAATIDSTIRADIKTALDFVRNRVMIYLVICVPTTGHH